MVSVPYVSTNQISFVTLASFSFLQSETFLSVSGKDTPMSLSPTYFTMLHSLWIYPHTENYASACLNTFPFRIHYARQEWEETM